MTKSESIRFFYILVCVVILTAGCGGSSIEKADVIQKWESEKGQLLSDAAQKTPEELLEQLESIDAKERIAAVIVLRELDPETLIPVIMKRRKGDHPQLQDEYRRMIKAWGSDAMPVLMGILGDFSKLKNSIYIEDYFNGWFAVEGLDALGPEAAEAIPLIVEALRNPVDSPVLIPDLCNVLESIGESSVDVIDALLIALNDEGTIFLQASACYALGELASPEDQEVIDRLVEYVEYHETNSDSIFWQKVIPARCALYKLGYETEENFEVIRERATADMDGVNPDGPTAWEALAKIGDERSIELLGNIILQSEDMGLILAFSELEKTGPRADVIEYFIKALDRPDFTIDVAPYMDPSGGDTPQNIPINVRIWAAYSLGHFGADARDALPEIIKLYGDLRLGNSDDRMEEDYAMIEEAIIRIHEGL